MKTGTDSRGILVCFVGIDGAGKSTLAKSLVAKAKDHGVRFKYVWGGFNSSFTIFRPFIAAVKGTVFRGDRYMEESKTKGRVVRSSLLSAIYQYLMLTDYVFQVIFRIRLPLALGRKVICDRYIYDLAAAVGVLLDYPADRTMALLDRCLAVVPRPDFVFLVDLPEALAYERKDDISSLEFLAVRRDIYLQMAQRHGMIMLDGSSDPSELAESVEETVLEHLEGTR